MERAKINLAALPSHKIIKVNVGGEQVDAILLPIKKNSMFLSEKGNVFIDLVLFENKEPMKDKDGAIIQTHMIKQSFPKDVREKMSNEEKMNQPIIGSACILGAFERQEKPAEPDADIAPTEDDLPF